MTTTSPAGTWQVTISTPIGKQHVSLQIVERAGALAGTATRGSETRGSETVPLVDVIWDGARLRWRQAVTKPMKLNLAFDVVITGDEMVGSAQAGVFPASKLEGKRQAGEP